MIETALYTLLTSTSSITALVSNRIFPLVVPEDEALPALTYQFIGGPTTLTLDRQGYTRYRVEIKCWGSKYLDAVSLRAAVNEALNGYTDQNFTSTVKINVLDLFDHDLLQYIAMIEFYITSPL